MSGYRDRPGFDPNGEPSRPARPFNAMQWTGLALIVVSVAFNLGYLAGEIGWLPKWHIGPTTMIGPLILGVVLVNSRQQPVQDLAPELASDRRRWLIIVGSICAVILGAATILALWGY